MAMHETSILEKAVKAGSAFSEKYLIGKFGSDDDTYVPGAASTDDINGVMQEAVESGKMGRVMLQGISRVKIGGTVNRGKPVTCDSSGHGVEASPGSGVNANVIGFAMATGADGDIIPVFLMPGIIQGE